MVEELITFLEFLSLCVSKKCTLGLALNVPPSPHNSHQFFNVQITANSFLIYVYGTSCMFVVFLSFFF